MGARRPTDARYATASPQCLHAGPVHRRRHALATAVNLCVVFDRIGFPRTIIWSLSTGGCRLFCLVGQVRRMRRLEKTFDSGDPELLRHFKELAADRLEVVAARANLGLDQPMWRRLAETVDLIVDSGDVVRF